MFGNTKLVLPYNKKKMKIVPSFGNIVFENWSLLGTTGFNPCPENTNLKHKLGHTYFTLNL